ncbi:MAG: MFS transporter, partial [Phenylobacterium sp.]
LLGGLLLNVGGWRWIFGFMAMFGAAIGVAAVLRMRESRSEATFLQAQSEHPLRAYLSLLKHRRLLGYGLAGALNGATLFTYISSSPELLIEIYHVPAASFGWVFGLNAVGVIGANQVNRMLLRRYLPDQVLARASLVSVVFGVLLALAAVTGVGGAWTVLPLLFALLSSYGFMQGNTMAGALSVDPLRAGSTSALLGGASFATGALASALAGLLHDGTPRPMALLMLAALLGSAVALRVLALPKAA